MRPRLDHLEEEAELYALGLLDGAEHERVERHVRTCVACAERLGRAEATVAALADATVAREAAPAALRARVPTAPAAAAPLRPVTRLTWRSPAAWAGAAAAVFAVTSGSLVVQNAALQSNVAADGSVFVAMVHSHFNHVQFTSLDGTPIDAKVVYERHGGWYEILATGIDPGTRVATVRAGAVTDAPERFVVRAAALTLALPALGAVDELRLLDAQGRLLARARPVLSADPR
jgi:hypothetical protein